MDSSVVNNDRIFLDTIEANCKPLLVEETFFLYAYMHLKNFSLLKHTEIGYTLCPAYDLVSSALIVKGDDEELALTLNGKKKKLKRQGF
ncbi:MAG: HipA domain-containing protein [Bacteroidia bacterium]